MGCFNVKGCMSNMPIEYGDKIVAFIGLINKKFGSEDYSPGYKFTPLSLAIYGIYNECGGIESIEKTASVKILEDFFGVDIDTLAESAARYKYDGLPDKLEKRYESFLQQIDDDFYDMHKKENLELTLLMEHESVFRTMVHLNEDRYKIINNDYTLDLELLKEACEYSQTDEFKDKHNALTKEFDNLELILSKVENMLMFNYVKRHNPKLAERKRGTFITDRNIFPLACNLFNIGEADEHLMLYPFKTVNPTEELREDLINFYCFYKSMLDLCLVWGVSNYYNETVFYDECITFLNASLKIMKNKIKNNKKYSM